MFSTISAYVDQPTHLQVLRNELTLITLSLLGQLGQVNGVLVTHCESGDLQISVVSKITQMRDARVVQQRAVANAQPAG